MVTRWVYLLPVHGSPSPPQGYRNNRPLHPCCLISTYLFLCPLFWAKTVRAAPEKKTFLKLKKSTILKSKLNDSFLSNQNRN